MRHAANEAKCTSALDIFERTNIRALRSSVSRLAGLRYEQRSCNIWAVRLRFPPEGTPVGTSAGVVQCGGCRDLSPVRLAQACQPCARATGNPDLPTGAEYFARRRKPRSPLADFRSAAGRKQPIVFSARCHGWCGSQKNTGVRQRRGDHGMVGHFAAAVPGQRPPRVRRQLAHAFDQHAGHRVGLVPVGSRDDHGVAGGAVDEGGDRRWARCEYQITLRGRPPPGCRPGSAARGCRPCCGSGPDRASTACRAAVESDGHSADGETCWRRRHSATAWTHHGRSTRARPASPRHRDVPAAATGRSAAVTTSQPRRLLRLSCLRFSLRLPLQLRWCGAQ